MHVIIHQGVRGANYLYLHGRMNAGGGSADEPLQTLNALPTILGAWCNFCPALEWKIKVHGLVQVFDVQHRQDLIDR